MKRYVRWVVGLLNGMLVFFAFLLAAMNLWGAPGLLGFLVVSWAVLNAIQVRYDKSWVWWRDGFLSAVIGCLVYLVMAPVLMRDLTWRDGIVADICFSPDSRLMAWRAGPIVHIREMATGRELRAMEVDPRFGGVFWPFLTLTRSGRPSRPHSTAFLSNGSALACSSWNNPVFLLDLNTGRTRTLPEESLRQLALSPDGSALLTGGELSDPSTDRSKGIVCTVWRLPEGRIERTISLSNDPDTRLADMAVSSDGRLWVCLDGQVQTWDTARWHRVHVLRSPSVAPNGRDTMMAVSRDGRWMVTHERNPKADVGRHILIVRETTTWRRVSTFPSAVYPTAEGWMHGLAISPDGRYVAERADRSVIVWDVRRGRKLPERSMDGYWGDIAFSPDGRYLAAGAGEPQVRVWPVSALAAS